MTSKFLTFLGVGAISMLALPVAALTTGITYEGQILKPDGTALAGHNAQFKMQVRTPDTGACLMYEELQTQDLSSSNGNFSITLNDGSGSRTDSSGYSLDRIFGNFGSYNFATATCASGATGTYAPSPNDGRSLTVLFKDETMANWETIPAEKINFAPFAIEAKQVQGFGADSILRVINTASGAPITGLAPLSNAQYTQLMVMLNGGGASIATAGTPTGAGVGTVWFDTSMNALRMQTSTGPQTVGGTGGITSIATGTGLTGGPISTSGTIALASTSVSPGSYGSSSMVPTFTVDSTGRLTAAGSVAVSSVPSGSAAGDLSGSYPNPAVATVGGSSASNLHAGELLANGATSLNIASTLIKRDSSGNFLANTATLSGLSLSNGASQNLAIVAPTGLSSWTMTLPASVGTTNQILSLSNTSGTTAWVNPPTSPWTTYGANVAYMAGNVGIGTTSPSLALDVVGAGNFTSGLKAATAVISASGLASAPSLSLGSPNLGLFTASGSAIGFTTSGTERMRLSDGGLAVGSNSATSELTVYSSSNVNPGATIYGSSGITLSLQDGGSNPMAGLELKYAGAGGHDWMVFSNGSGGPLPQGSFSFYDSTTSSTRMLIDQVGNVGIGTTSPPPTAKLTVAGSIVSTSRTISSGTGVDLSLANSFTLVSPGTSTINLANLSDGGQYNIIVTDMTQRTYTFNGCTNTVFKPANAATTASTQTIYNLITVRNGANWNCYVKWDSGYQ